jgi:hypothetical protein
VGQEYCPTQVIELNKGPSLRLIGLKESDRSALTDSESSKERQLIELHGHNRTFPPPCLHAQSQIIIGQLIELHDRPLEEKYWCNTVKKVIDFPFSSRDDTNQTLPGRG